MMSVFFSLCKNSNNFPHFLCPMGIPLLQTMVRINESLHKHKEGATAGLLNVADVSIHYRRRERTCHNIGPARERAFISVCENKGIKNNIYTIAVSKSTLVIGLGSNAYK